MTYFDTIVDPSLVPIAGRKLVFASTKKGSLLSDYPLLGGTVSKTTTSSLDGQVTQSLFNNSYYSVTMEKPEPKNVWYLDLSGSVTGSVNLSGGLCKTYFDFQDLFKQDLSGSRVQITPTALYPRRLSGSLVLNVTTQSFLNAASETTLNLVSGSYKLTLLAGSQKDNSVGYFHVDGFQATATASLLSSATGQPTFKIGDIAISNTTPSASYARTASYALNGGPGGGSSVSSSWASSSLSASFATTASFSQRATSASYALQATNTLQAVNADIAATAISANSATFALSADSASVANTAKTASHTLGSASYASASAFNALKFTSGDWSTYQSAFGNAVGFQNADTGKQFLFDFDGKVIADNFQGTSSVANTASHASTALSATSASYAFSSTTADQINVTAGTGFGIQKIVMVNALGLPGNSSLKYQTAFNYDAATNLTYTTSSWAINATTATTATTASFSATAQTASYLSASYAVIGLAGTASNPTTTNLELVSNSSDYFNNNGAGACLTMRNRNATGQNVVASYNGNTLLAKWRTDYAGNIGWIAVGPTNNGYHAFYTQGDYPVGSSKLFISASGLVGIGTNHTAPVARLHVIDTLEQLRVGYDTNNYVRHIVDASGNCLIDNVGTNASCSFADRVSFKSGATGSLLGTASVAITASYANTVNTASVFGGGLTMTQSFVDSETYTNVIHINKGLITYWEKFAI